MKKVMLMFAVGVGILLVLGLAKNRIVQSAMQGAINGMFPVTIRIGSLNLSLIQGSVEIRDLKVMNDEASSEKHMADLPLIYINVNPLALLKKQAHFEEVRLYLKELMIVKEKSGKLNVDALKPSAPTDSKRLEAKTGASGLKKESEPMKLRIDKFYLSFDRVVYKDYSQGGNPLVQTFDVNIKDRLFENIENPTQIAGVIMMEAISKTALNRLVSFDISSFKDQAQGLMNQALGPGGNVSEKAEEAAKGLLKLLN